MEAARDIVIIVTGITVTLTFTSFTFMVIRLYPKASKALDRMSRAAEDIQGAVEGARSGMRAATGILETAMSLAPGIGWVNQVSRAATSVARSVSVINPRRRSKNKPTGA